jgi:hypothetical protein
VSVDAPPDTDLFDEDALLADPDVRSAFETLRGESACYLSGAGPVRIQPSAIIRGHEIHLEDALVFPGQRRPVRFVKGTDLLTIVDIVRTHQEVGDVLDAYLRTRGTVPVPHLLAALSLLVARGILTVGRYRLQTKT